MSDANDPARPPDAARPVYAEVFGCQMNKLDAQITLEHLLRDEYRLVDTPKEADIVLFFTCAVRQHAEDRFFSRLGAYARVKERRPGLTIAVCGCVAEEHGAALRHRFPFVDVLCGTRHFPRLPALIREAQAGAAVTAVGERAVTYTRAQNLAGRPAQAFVAVMRGCSLNCTYCIVPQVRGREVSRPVPEIVEEVNRLVAGGVVEVTLLGQTVNAYGRSLGPEHSLARLLYRLGEIDGLRRLRFVTSHPRFMTDELIEAMRSIPSVCEGLHLPAQSGSNEVLRRMGRTYTREAYLATVGRCYKRIPGFALAGDMIVGFPGETAEDFARTESLVREARYQNLFVFKYSERPGTPAAKLADDVPRAVKQERNRRLLALHQEIALERYRSAIGTAVEVLVEGPSARNPDTHTGRTRTGQIAIFPPGPAPGTLATVRVHDATALALYGEVETGGEAA
jgi:tRNA-2-methylthio-N6-dimethylallyladenosine synthase